MNKLIALAAAALTAGCAYDGDTQSSASASRTAEVDYRGRTLAQVLEGRRAERPRSCVSSRELGGNEGFGENVILFRGQTNSVVFVNRPTAGCPEIGPGRAIRVRTPSAQICSGEIIDVFDPVAGFDFGSCALGEFTPYRR